MAVSRRLRFEILRRDNHTCRYCGASAPDVKLTVDHVNPSALGGEDTPDNLVTACQGCNGGKSSVPPDASIVADVAADALRWSGALQYAAQEMLSDLDRRNAARTEFDAAWSVWGTGQSAARQAVPRPAGWEQSIDRFVSAGLPMRVLLDCISSAMSNSKVRPEDTFRYMCGIAWKKVQQLQETARESVTSTSPKATGKAPDPGEMYQELTGYVFGILGGVNCNEDVAVLALVRGAELGEDEDPNALDTEGHAACEVLSRTGAILSDYQDAASMLVGPLPIEVFHGLHDRAAGELNWHPRLQAVDGGHLYREALGARMFLYCAQELINGSGEATE